VSLQRGERLRSASGLPLAYLAIAIEEAHTIPTPPSAIQPIYLVVADILRLTASLSDLHWYHLRFRIVYIKLRAVAFGNGEKFLPQKKKFDKVSYHTNSQPNGEFVKKPLNW